MGCCKYIVGLYISRKQCFFIGNVSLLNALVPLMIIISKGEKSDCSLVTLQTKLHIRQGLVKRMNLLVAISGVYLWNWSVISLMTVVMVQMSKAVKQVSLI